MITKGSAPRAGHRFKLQGYPTVILFHGPRPARGGEAPSVFPTAIRLLFGGVVWVHGALHSPQRRCAARAEARMHKHHLAWEGTAEKLLRFVDAVVSGGPVRPMIVSRTLSRVASCG